MSAIEKVSFKLSEKLGTRLDKSKEEVAVLNYGMFVILHTILGILFTLIVGAVTGLIIEMMIISITTAIFKRYSGGVHASTPEKCMIIGVILSLLLSLVCKYVVGIANTNTMVLIALIILIFCYYILYIKCPVPSKNKPLKKESTRKLLRKKAFILANICTIFVILSIMIYHIFKINSIKVFVISLLLGMYLQMFVLTKIGSRIIELLDKLLSIIIVNNT